jgi:hypothetical protein
MARHLIALAAAVFLSLAFVGVAQAQDIVVVNHSTVITDAQIQIAIPAFQASIDQAVGPVWNVSATIYFGAPPVGDTNYWTITVQDNIDCWGCAGYHSFAHNLPYAVVDTQTSLNWELILSHELDEMLIDPYINRAAGRIICNPFACWTNIFYLQEIADPVEYNWWKINDVYISDFVTQRWYMGDRYGSDYLGLLDKKHKRFGLLHGGYKTFFKNGYWQSQSMRHTFKVRHHP